MWNNRDYCVTFSLVLFIFHRFPPESKMHWTFTHMSIFVIWTCHSTNSIVNDMSFSWMYAEDQSITIREVLLDDIHSESLFSATKVIFLSISIKQSLTSRRHISSTHSARWARYCEQTLLGVLPLVRPYDRSFGPICWAAIRCLLFERMKLSSYCFTCSALWYRHLHRIGIERMNWIGFVGATFDASAMSLAYSIWMGRYLVTVARSDSTIWPVFPQIHSFNHWYALRFQVVACQLAGVSHPRNDSTHFLQVREKYQ